MPRQTGNSQRIFASPHVDLDSTISALQPNDRKRRPFKHLLPSLGLNCDSRQNCMECCIESQKDLPLPD